jgi:hypothetical protein
VNSLGKFLDNDLESMYLEVRPKDEKKVRLFAYVILCDSGNQLGPGMLFTVKNYIRSQIARSGQVCNSAWRH